MGKDTIFNDIRPSSAARYDDVIKLFNSYIKQSRTKEKFSFEMVRDFLNTINNPNTHNVSIQALKKYFRKLYEKKSLSEQAKLFRFFETIRKKKPDKTVGKNKYFTPDEVKQLVDNATQRNACVIEALFYSGSRISAMLDAKVADCETVGQYVLIKTIAKCDIEHTVVIPLDLFNRIRYLFHGKVYLFETVEGNRYSREYISREIKDTGKSINMKANCHKFRHSLAMYLKEKGHSPDEIANVLGHQGVLTTLEHYFHGKITPEQQLNDLTKTLTGEQHESI